MHECYAMQILYKKKRMVIKSIEMKHKDQKGQGWLGTHNHTNYLMKCFKLTSIKRLGEDVNILTFSRDIFQSKNQA